MFWSHSIQFEYTVTLSLCFHKHPSMAFLLTFVTPTNSNFKICTPVHKKVYGNFTNFSWLMAQRRGLRAIVYMEILYGICVMDPVDI